MYLKIIMDFQDLKRVTVKKDKSSFWKTALKSKTFYTSLKQQLPISFLWAQLYPQRKGEIISYWSELLLLLVCPLVKISWGKEEEEGKEPKNLFILTSFYVFYSEEIFTWKSFYNMMLPHERI